MSKKLALMAFAVIFPASAAIAGPAVSGVVDLYAIPKTVLDVKDPDPLTGGQADDDGDGFGVKGLLKLGAIAAFTLDYQRSDYDSLDGDVEQYRLGIGAVLPSNVGGFVEYIKLDLDKKDPDGEADGFGLHVRYAMSPLADVQVYGDIGYLMLKFDGTGGEDLDGLEYTLGGVFSVAENWGFFTDYRVTDLEIDTIKVELKFSDIRLGTRYEFGV